MVRDRILLVFLVIRKDFVAGRTILFHGVVPGHRAGLVCSHCGTLPVHPREEVHCPEAFSYGPADGSGILPELAVYVGGNLPRET
jgi:hypothetical protein